MPFGSFMIQEKELNLEKIKPETFKQNKSTEEKHRIIKGKPIKEHKSIKQKFRKSKKTYEDDLPVEENFHIHEFSGERKQMNILFWGRNLWSMQDFLCSLKENMSNALHKEGLTYFAAERIDINDIIERKRKLENYFWEFSNVSWGSEEEQTGNFRKYTFNITPSGNQDKILNLLFHCCAFEEAVSCDCVCADAVCFLVDGPVLDEEVGYDTYREFISDKLRDMSGAEIPTCLILSQIEKYGHFHGVDEQSVLEDKVNERFKCRCRELFADIGVQAALIPVQVYGGIEYFGIDINCEPKLHLSESGYSQSYIPKNCQIPIFYAISKILEKQGEDYFVDISGEGIKKVIHHHFQKIAGETNWAPDMLKEIEQQ